MSLHPAFLIERLSIEGIERRGLLYLATIYSAEGLNMTFLRKDVQNRAQNGFALPDTFACTERSSG